MAAVLLFWDTNMAAMTSCENTLLFYLQLAIYFRLARFSLVSLAAFFCSSSRDETTKAL